MSRIALGKKYPTQVGKAAFVAECAEDGRHLIVAFKDECTGNRYGQVRPLLDPRSGTSAKKNIPAKKSDDSGSSGRVLAVRQREPFLVVCGVPTAIGALYEARRLVIAVFVERGQTLVAEYT